MSSKKFFFTSVLVSTMLLLYFSSSATIRRVGFFGIPLPGVDYATFALAQTASTAGDTILVFPVAASSSLVYGNVDKKLIIIGTGNWLDSSAVPKGNAGMQAFSATTPIYSTLAFRTGSSGSVIMGFDFAGQTVYIGDNNITLRRNLNMVVNLAYNPNPAGTSVAIAINNLQILENYHLVLQTYYSNGFTQSNLNISNNFMNYVSLSVGNNYNGNFSNNVWAYDGTLSPANNGGSATLSGGQGIDFGNGSFLFQNNILCSYTNAAVASNFNYFVFANANNTVFNYNLALQSYNFNSWGIAGTGNVTTPISNFNSIFQGFPAVGTRTADDRYQLGAVSPALISNRPGSTADAGIYGGNSPYKLSMIPSIPTIYRLSSPQGNNPPGSTIQINLSTRSNN